MKTLGGAGVSQAQALAWAKAGEFVGDKAEGCPGPRGQRVLKLDQRTWILFPR